MDELFASVYDNINNYKLIVCREMNVGNYIFGDDIISECIEKLATDITNGKIKLTDLQYKDTKKINHSYFSIMLVRKIRDKQRLKKVIKTTQIESNQVAEQEIEVQKIDAVDQLEHIRERLNEYAKNDIHSDYHSKIFKYLYLDNMSSRQLEAESKVSRYAIAQSKNFSLPLVRSWLKENNNTMITQKAIVGINEEGKQLPFPSMAAAKREGYNVSHKAIETQKSLKGYKFNYARTTEDAINEPSTGLGDTVAKVLNSKYVKPLTDTVKGLFWDGEDCGCNERLNKWNELLSYRETKAVRFFTKSEFEEFRPLAEAKLFQPTKPQTKFIADIHADIFGHKVNYPCLGCGSGSRAYIQWHRELKKLWLSI